MPDPNRLTPFAVRVLGSLVTHPSGYGKTKRRKKPAQPPPEPPRATGGIFDDIPVGPTDETPQTGDKPT